MRKEKRTKSKSHSRIEFFNISHKPSDWTTLKEVTLVSLSWSSFSVQNFRRNKSTLNSHISQKVRSVVLLTTKVKISEIFRKYSDTLENLGGFTNILNVFWLTTVFSSLFLWKKIRLFVRNNPVQGFPVKKKCIPYH